MGTFGDQEDRTGLFGPGCSQASLPACVSVVPQDWTLVVAVGTRGSHLSRTWRPAVELDVAALSACVGGECAPWRRRRNKELESVGKKRGRLSCSG